MKKLLIAIVIPYLITGCATTYHQKNIFGGYSDQKFEKDVYQIGFDALLFTDPDDIELYIQYRSAEIVVEQGYQYYTINEYYTSSSRNSITIKIFKDKPNDIDVRDANEVIESLHFIIDKHMQKERFLKPIKYGAITIGTLSGLLLFNAIVILGR